MSRLPNREMSSIPVAPKDAAKDAADLSHLTPAETGIGGRSEAAIPAGSPWTPARIEQLLALVQNKGLSARDIADTLGVSRNAIIGKCQRIGLALPNAHGVRNAAAEAARKAKRTQWKPTASKVDSPNFRRNDHRRNVAKDPRLDCQQFKLRPVIDMPIEQRKTFLQLTDTSCRWPVGDPKEPGFFFCGAPTAKLSQDRAYCPGHMAVAYNYVAEPMSPVRKAPNLMEMAR